MQVAFKKMWTKRRKHSVREASKTCGKQDEISCSSVSKCIWSPLIGYLDQRTTNKLVLPCSQATFQLPGCGLGVSFLQLAVHGTCPSLLGSPCRRRRESSRLQMW